MSLDATRLKAAIVASLKAKGIRVDEAAALAPVGTTGKSGLEVVSDTIAEQMVTEVTSHWDGASTGTDSILNSLTGDGVPERVAGNWSMVQVLTQAAADARYSTPSSVASAVAASQALVLAALDAAAAGLQPKNDNLTAIAAKTGTGYLKRVGSALWDLVASIPWSDLTGFPMLSAGAGLTGGGSLASAVSLAVAFAGTGSLATAAHSDHNHDSTYLGIGATAADATKLATSRTIAAMGDATWSVSFDGSANVSAALTLASLLTAGTVGGSTVIPILTYDTKGRLTGVSATSVTPAWSSITGKPTTISGYGITDTASQALTGYVVGANSALAATDTILGAFGKMQGQFNGLSSAYLGISATAAAATKLATSRTITATGDATWSVSFDGSANVSAALTLASLLTAGSAGSATSIPVLTYDAKGRLTAVSTASVTPAWSSITGKPTTISGYGITDTASQALTGYVVGANSALAATDTILGAFGKIQGQFNGLSSAYLGIGATAAAATKLATSRTIAATGDATWSVSFDGSANVSAALTLASLLTAGSAGSGTQVPVFSYDAKGRLLSVSTAAITPAGIGALALTGGTLSGDLTFSDPAPTGGSTVRGIYGPVGTNDAWRIVGGATATNSGYLEIATADDANEPIYVRQYAYGSGSGSWQTLTRTLTLLDASGYTSIPGNTTIGGQLIVAPSGTSAVAGISLFAANLSSGQNASIGIGKANTSQRSAYLTWQQGATDAASYATLETYGASSPLRLISSALSIVSVADVSGQLQVASSGIPNSSGTYGLRIGLAADMGAADAAALMIAVPSSFAPWVFQVDKAGAGIFGIDTNGNFSRTGMTAGGFVRAAASTGALSAAALTGADLDPRLKISSAVSIGSGIGIGNVNSWGSFRFMIGQSDSGATYIEASPGQFISLGLDGLEYMHISSAGIAVSGPGLSSGSISCDYLTSHVSIGAVLVDAADYTGNTVSVTKVIAGTIDNGGMRWIGPKYFSNDSAMPNLDVNEACLLVCNSDPGANVYWTTAASVALRYRSTGSTMTTVAANTQFPIPANGTTWILFGPAYGGGRYTLIC